MKLMQTKHMEFLHKYFHKRAATVTFTSTAMASENIERGSALNSGSAWLYE